MNAVSLTKAEECICRNVEITISRRWTMSEKTNILKFDHRQKPSSKSSLLFSLLFSLSMVLGVFRKIFCHVKKILPEARRLLDRLAEVSFSIERLFLLSLFL